MKLEDFNYDLPEHFIAQTPIERRDHSKLLVYDRASRKTEIRQFFNILDYLKKGDVVVINTTRVMNVRYVKKQGFVPASEDTVPLPPYIKAKLTDVERYQTVYNKTTGSLAAPTAGLHWTPELMQAARDKGVTFAEVLLHVGIGTFRPVRVDNIVDHKMHSEYYEIPREAAATINQAKAEGRRIICVGTTSLRALEAAAVSQVTGDTGHVTGNEKFKNNLSRVTCHVSPGCGDTDIFIYPPFEFKIADALITNFHLPKSTLIMLVAAFLENSPSRGEGVARSDGVVEVLSLYEFAKKNDFRFFSFGDCMFLC